MPVPPAMLVFSVVASHRFWLERGWLPNVGLFISLHKIGQAGSDAVSDIRLQLSKDKSSLSISGMAVYAGIKFANASEKIVGLKIVRRLIPDWGTTYGPPGEGPFPVVMIFHGSEGAWSGWSHRNAVLLAAHGFLAFPFGYSIGGNAWNAGSIEDVPLDRSLEALAALRAFPVASDKLAFYGVSRGAEHALLLTSLMARDGLTGLPDAVAAHSPPDVVCGAFDARRYRDSSDPGWQAWDPSKRAWSWRGTSADLLPTNPIEIECFDGPLFLSHGTADRVWSVEMTRRLAARLKENGRTPEVHYYENQDHIPGSAAENEHHEHLISFLERHLR